MSLQGWQTFWQIAIAAGIILGAVGGFGLFMVNRRIEDAKEKQIAIEAKWQQRTDFRSKIHFQRLSGYWIEVRTGVYQVGLIAEILNKDNTSAHIIHGGAFQGSFQVGGPGGRFAISTLVISDASKSITGQYFLSPGGETKIKLILPSFVEMEIIDGVPGLTFDGKWVFRVEDEYFELTPMQTKMVGVLSLEQWENGK